MSGNDLDTNLMIYCPESSFKNLLTAQMYVVYCRYASSENLFFKGYVSLSCNWLYLVNSFYSLTGECISVVDYEI